MINFNNHVPVFSQKVEKTGPSEELLFHSFIALLMCFLHSWKVNTGYCDFKM